MEWSGTSKGTEGQGWHSKQEEHTCKDTKYLKVKIAQDTVNAKSS